MGTAGARYPRFARILHWSLALVVIVQVVLIVILHQLQSLEFAQLVLSAHKQCGVLAMALATARLVYGLSRRPPAPAEHMPRWQGRIATGVHLVMLAILAFQPMLGLLQVWGRGDEVVLLGLVTVPQLLTPTSEQGLLAAGLHRWSGIGLVALIAIHLGALAFNRLVRGGWGLDRMLAEQASNRLTNRTPVSFQLTLVGGLVLAMTTATGIYAAHQYTTINALRTGYADHILAPLDDLRAAQLALKSIDPGAAGFAAAVDEIKSSLSGIETSAPKAEAALARARSSLAMHGSASGTALRSASDSLDAAVDEQAAAAFEESVRIEQVGARGHDLIILTLAPTVLTAALLFFLLARSLMSAVAQARVVVRSVTDSCDLGPVAVQGRGELAALMREILRMRAAVQSREYESAAEQFRQQAKLESLRRKQLQARNNARRNAAARRQAEELNRAKSEFLANMSHEIRTPLNGVLGMAQAMANDEMPERQRQRLDVVRQSGESLLGLLNDLLDISKIEAGKLELESVIFDLAGLARGACAPFKEIAEQRGITFELNLAPGVGHCIGDPTRVRQVVANLSSNALKFTERGRIEVSAVRTGDSVRICVADSGVGMAPDAIEKMFHKFTQADASTTRRFGGTGLGLAICRDLIQLMGGRIDAESVEGEGSRFIVDLPLPCAEVAPAEIAAEAAALEETSDLRVLAAEDNPTNQLVISTLLQQAGIEVTMVDNGAQAVEAWRAKDWDIILMDVQMPVMDGPAATQEIRKSEAASGRRRTPIIALTANAMTHQAVDYMACGMDAVVAKPIKIESLFHTMELLLSGADAEAEAQPEALAS